MNKIGLIPSPNGRFALCLLKFVTLPPILGHPSREACAAANDNRACANAARPGPEPREPAQPALVRAARAPVARRACGHGIGRDGGRRAHAGAAGPGLDAGWREHRRLAGGRAALAAAGGPGRADCGAAVGIALGLAGGSDGAGAGPSRRHAGQRAGLGRAALAGRGAGAGAGLDGAGGDRAPGLGARDGPAVGTALARGRRRAGAGRGAAAPGHPAGVSAAARGGLLLELRRPPRAGLPGPPADGGLADRAGRGAVRPR